MTAIFLLKVTQSAKLLLNVTDKNGEFGIMAKQDEQLQEILDGMSKLIETSNLNQQQLNAFKEQVGELQSEIKALTEQVAELKAQNELTNCHFRELYKTQSLEELLEKMSSIGKEAVHADECVVYGMNDEEFPKFSKLTESTVTFMMDGDRHHVMLVPLEDQQGDIIGIVYAKRDGDKMFTEIDAKVFNLNEGELGTIFRASLEQKMAENNAVTDKLTKLKNREGMSNFIKNEVLSRVQEDKPVSVVMFDIDHFKRFNDTYGHDIGDKCLKLVADTIKNNVRTSDSGVFRWGGEEMIVILPVNEEMAFEIAERVRHAIEATSLVVNDKTQETTQVTVSGGISEFCPKSIELDKNRIEAAFERCLKEADNALYMAKENGRNRVYGSDTLMRDHYSLPSPTELFQYWYDRRNQMPNQDLILLTACYGEKDNHWVVVNNTPQLSTPQWVHSYVENDNITQMNRLCIEDIIATDVFYRNVNEILITIASEPRRQELYGQYLDDTLHLNKCLAFAVVDEWERVKDTLEDDVYREYSADVEAIKAMVYTPDAINVKDIVDDRREKALDKLDALLSKEHKAFWWNDFKKACSNEKFQNNTDVARMTASGQPATPKDGTGAVKRSVSGNKDYER